MLMQLEEQLSQDHSGAALHALVEQFNSERQRLKSALDAGVTQADYPPIKSMIEALDSSVCLLDCFWKKYHRSG